MSLTSHGILSQKTLAVLDGVCRAVATKMLLFVRKLKVSIMTF